MLIPSMTLLVVVGPTRVYRKDLQRSLKAQAVLLNLMKIIFLKIFLRLYYKLIDQ